MPSSPIAKDALECTYLQKKVYKMGLWVCEKCPMYQKGSYQKGDSQLTCASDKCSANQIQRRDGFCLQCGEGAKASDDGKSCENVQTCSATEFIGYNGSCYPCYPGYKASEDRKTCEEDTNPQPSL